MARFVLTVIVLLCASLGKTNNLSTYRTHSIDIIQELHLFPLSLVNTHSFIGLYRLCQFRCAYAPSVGGARKTSGIPWSDTGFTFGRYVGPVSRCHSVSRFKRGKHHIYVDWFVSVANCYSNVQLVIEMHRMDDETRCNIETRISLKRLFCMFCYCL